MEEQLTFANRTAFRAWLAQNSAASPGVWMVFSKSGKSIKPDEALEEALCFGWIDGQIKSIDEEKYMKKLTPRRPGSKWSPKNRTLAESLTKSGKMTERGIKAIEQAKANGDWNMAGRPVITKEQIEILIKDIGGAEPALSNFLKMPLSTRQTYTGYYLSAKKEETRVNRIKKIIDALDKNNKSPMF